MTEMTEMSFWDHLETLRWVLMRVIIVLVVLIIVGFAFIPDIFDKVVMAPIADDFFFYRFLNRLSAIAPIVPDTLSEPFHVDIINIKLASQFFMHITLSLWLALIVAFPYIMYEVWHFVCPALYDNERRKVRFTFVFGTVMFYVGCVVGYTVVFPLTLRFLYTYQISPEITNQLSLDSYMSNFLMLIFMMGLVFELPLVSMLLSRLGILDRSFFSKYRRHAIVACLVLAAVITPSADPFTLTAVFIPTYVLWELSAFLVKPASKDEEVQSAEIKQEN